VVSGGEIRKSLEKCRLVHHLLQGKDSARKIKEAGPNLTWKDTRYRKTMVSSVGMSGEAYRKDDKEEREDKVLLAG